MATKISEKRTRCTIDLWGEWRKGNHAGAIGCLGGILDALATEIQEQFRNEIRQAIDHATEAARAEWRADIAKALPPRDEASGAKIEPTPVVTSIPSRFTEMWYTVTDKLGREWRWNDVAGSYQPIWIGSSCYPASIIDDEWAKGFAPAPAAEPKSEAKADRYTKMDDSLIDCYDREWVRDEDDEAYVPAWFMTTGNTQVYDNEWDAGHPYRCVPEPEPAKPTVPDRYIKSKAQITDKLDRIWYWAVAQSYEPAWNSVTSYWTEEAADQEWAKGFVTDKPKPEPQPTANEAIPLSARRLMYDLIWRLEEIVGSYDKLPEMRRAMHEAGTEEDCREWRDHSQETANKARQMLAATWKATSPYLPES